jgi:hypothetical protein
MWHEDTRGPGEGGGAESMLRDLTKGIRALGHEVAWLHTEHIAEAVDAFKPDVVNIGTIFNRMGWEPVKWLLEHKFPSVWSMMDYYPFCGGRMLLRNWDEGCTAVKGACDNNCAEKHAPRYWMELVNQFPVLVLNHNTADIYRHNGMRVDYVAELGVDTDLFKPDPVERSPELQIYTASAWAEYPAKGMRYLRQAIEGTPFKVNLMTHLTREQVALGLKRADIFVFPSTYEETWGLCLAEALASGCACIASDVAGPRAQVHEGQGILVPPRDVKALREALYYLADNKQVRDNMGIAARTHNEIDHTLEAMAKRFIRIYQQVLEV